MIAGVSVNVIAALVIMAAIIAAALWLKRSGAIAQREKDAAIETKNVLDARKVERDVAGLSDADVDKRLSDFTRK